MHISARFGLSGRQVFHDGHWVLTETPTEVSASDDQLVVSSDPGLRSA